MIISKTCSPTGDYSDLVTAINDMIVSGVANSSITDFYLNVDNGTYTGQFDITIPNSGMFYINGNDTTFIPTGSCSVSGVYRVGMNLNINNLYIDCSGIESNYFLTISDDCGFSASHVEFINTYNVFNNYGYAYISDVNSCGPGSGVFINSSGSLSINTSTVSDYTYGIKQIGESIISDCVLFGNDFDLYSSVSTNLGVDRTLLYGSINMYLNDTILSMSNSTLVSSVPISGNNTEISISHSILDSDGTYTIFGTSVSGFIEYTNLYASGWQSANISGAHNYNQDPVFVDETNNDYRLLVNSENGSFAINAGERIPNSNIDIETSTDKFMVYNSQDFRVPHINVREFLYKQGQTIVFTDYGREVRMAELLSAYDNNNLTYQQVINLLLTLYNVPVTKSFNDSGEDIYPYEWDYWTAPTTEITEENKFIIPRSVVDIAAVILPYMVGYGFNFGILQKNNIRVQNKVDYRGISYDADLVSPGAANLWIVEGRNQKLLKRSAYTTEVEFEYPLLTPNVTTLIRPQGIILLGPFKDKWKFIDPTNPRLEYIAETKLGDFSWINPSMDMYYDLRGVLAYKEHLYITGTRYIYSIMNRDTTNITTSGTGSILLYGNNQLYSDYMSSPTIFELDTHNRYPTDLSIYEDGTIWIADYASGIYQYKPAYDYGLVENNYDREVVVLLKENYNNVEI